MDLGSNFCTLRDGEWLDCRVVWTGGMPIHPESAVSFASSLVPGESRQPAKPSGLRGARSPRSAALTSQVALRP